MSEVGRISLDKMQFAGRGYRARGTTGGSILFETSAGTPIGRLAGYRAQFAWIHNLRAPVDSERAHVVLEHAHGLTVGDRVEIRNEYQLARANLPLRHRCRIVEISGDEIAVTPRPTDPQLCGQAGTYLVRTVDVEFVSFAAEGVEAHDDGSDTWLLRARDGLVDVTLAIKLDAELQDVVFEVRRRFGTDVRVHNEQVRFDGLPPLREVYRKNRQIDDGTFQRRYNLEREGALFARDAECALYTYRSLEVSSVVVECPKAAFRLSSLTTFSPPPHDAAAALEGPYNRYASSARSSEEAVLLLEFDEPVEAHGLRVLWYQPLRRPERVRIEAHCEGRGWVAAADWQPRRSEHPVEVIALDEPLMATALRVRMTPDADFQRVALRAIDVLVGGDGYELVMNLDDHRDHRYCRFMDPEKRAPEMKPMYLEARSATPRRAGETASAQFTLRLGRPPSLRPRLLQTPGGARAMLIWTEHADRTTIATHRAVYFGSSAVVDAANASGGFCGHGVPVTKSVFLANPDARPCSATHPDPQASLADEDFHEFCTQLAALGHEICPHAPQPNDAPPDAGEVTAATLAEAFRARTWIDHGAQVVHLAMSGQGCNPASPHYMVDSWRRHGYRYFWQFASEDTAEQRVGSINLQQLRFGDWLHTPLTWTHPAETGDFVSWASIRGGDLDVYTPEALDELVSEWGVCITHTYPAALYDDPARNQYLREVEGGYRTTERFENVLVNIASRVATGDLLVTTVGHAAEHWDRMAAIRLHFDGEGVVVLNSADVAIEGLTFAVRGDFRTVGDAHPARVTVGRDTLVTVDLGPKQSVRLLPT